MFVTGGVVIFMNTKLLPLETRREPTVFTKISFPTPVLSGSGNEG